MTPVERVARAICAAYGDDPDERTVSFDERDIAFWEIWIDEARAAIEAMVPTSEDQKEAGADAMIDVADIDVPQTHYAEVAYVAMLRAALEEK